MSFTIHFVCHCMSLPVYLMIFFFILDSRLSIFGKKLSFWPSACLVLIVVPLLYVRPSFPLVSWVEGVM